jgi:hypothetical protein
MSTSDLLNRFENSQSELDEICVLQILSGQGTPTSNCARNDDREWVQKRLIIHKILIGQRIDMRGVTEGQVHQLADLIKESEPVCDTIGEQEAPLVSLDELKEQVHHGADSYDMACAILSANPDCVRWLLQNTAFRPSGKDLLFAAEHGYVLAAERLIMDGAHMDQFPSPKWPWWVKYTQRRIVATRNNILCVMSIFNNWCRLPPEIVEKIAKYIWASRFHLATWNGERDWILQTRRAMAILF